MHPISVSADRDQAFWLYSYRDVEELLEQHGLDVSFRILEMNGASYRLRQSKTKNKNRPA